jgi:hypothetical protein
MSRLIIEDTQSFFDAEVNRALKRIRFEPMPASRRYLVDLLQRFMITQNLFASNDSLAEVFLKAQNSAEPSVRVDLYRHLGDSSLFFSGFFSEWLSRRLPDLDYYVGIGGVAYSALSQSSADEELAQMYAEFSAHFSAFVDVLEVISHESMPQTNENLLRLYDRYLATGSRQTSLKPKPACRPFGAGGVSLGLVCSIWVSRNFCCWACWR